MVRANPASAAHDVLQEAADLFAPEAEPDLFGESYKPPVFYPDPDRVRLRLQAMLAEVRAAGPHGLAAEKAGLYQLVFPQMTGCLPDEEAAQLRLEFQAAMAGKHG